MLPEILVCVKYLLTPERSHLLLIYVSQKDHIICFSLGSFGAIIKAPQNYLLTN